MTIEEALDYVDDINKTVTWTDEQKVAEAFYDNVKDWLEELKKLREQSRWIPVTERLPETTDAVNIVWVNHNPPPYYSNIKDKPFSATGHYFKGNWYWYSSVCKDFLNEYGKNDIDLIDNDIEITHWMPLPQPYKEEGAE